ncbi:MAG: hypothetical protein NT116_00485, partial [Candidatus Parcubacteria bacterium]|nr:hypothetical protein [Candidatus Parcubacteria bacterium]
DAPLPYALAQEPAYKGLSNIYNPGVLLQNIGNGCFYAKEEVTGATSFTPLNLYQDLINNGTTPKICTSPAEKLGIDCASTGKENNCESTATIGGVETNSNSCTTVDKATKFSGLEGMCLEFDTLNPLYYGVYNTFYQLSRGINNYQPYACLTYYPFSIDTCHLHLDPNNCNLNPACELTTQCIQKPLQACNTYTNQNTCNLNPACTWTTECIPLLGTCNLITDETLCNNNTACTLKDMGVCSDATKTTKETCEAINETWTAKNICTQKS